MSLWRHFTRGLRTLVHRRSADRDIADEVESYLEQAAAAHRESGLAPEDARRAALLEMGNATSIREQVREYGWENKIGGLFADLRHAARRLCRKPGFTAAGLLTLTLGIGATSAIFSVIHGVLLKPLPFRQSEQIVGLRHTAPGINIPDLNMAASLYFVYKDESRVFQDVALWSEDGVTVTGAGNAEEVPSLTVTSRFLRVLGVQPVIGRAFNPSDEDPGSEQAVILSDGYWKSHFGADPSVLARRLVMDGSPVHVVGVLPPAFEFMDRTPSLLVARRMNRQDIRLISFCCQGIARLKPGVTLDQANADVARMLAIAPARFPVNHGFSADSWATARIAPRLRFLKDVLIGDMGKTLWLLMGTVSIVLLIACANVANLLLVRAAGRQQELAIRAALGAGWGRIAGELLIESLLLAMAACFLGLALAYGAVRTLTASGMAHLPRLHDIAIDPTVVVFTVSISLCSILLFGLIPVLKYARPRSGDFSNALCSGGRSLSQSKEQARSRNVLVVLQVALAVVLLAGAGLMIRTFRALSRVDPGFSDARHVETLRISIPETQVKDDERAIRLEEEILRRIEAIGGVSAAALANFYPMESNTNDPVYSENPASASSSKVPPIRRYKYVSPGYFSAIGTRLLVGRDLTWSETYNRRAVALVSENMARELWGSPRAALGKRIRPGLKDDWREVIGVVADLHDDGVDQKAPTIVYWPLLLKNFEGSETYAIRSVAIVVHTPRAGSAGLLQDLRNAVASVNPDVPVANVTTLQSVYDHSLARTSFALVLLVISGGMALLLSVIGLYGVISYSASQRTREIGIRLALGAQLPGVTWMFVRHGLVLSAIGAVWGLAGGFALTRLMKSQLYEVSPADPLTYLCVSAGLMLASALASYLPARMAATVDPVTTLRGE
jgi:predicted permease